MVDQDEKKQSEGIIDENLRRVYNETVEEGIPDRFKDLLDQLREQDSGKGSEG